MRLVFDTIWYGRSPLRFALWPFSLIYKSCVAFKAWLYRHRLRKSIKFKVPVIVVGNITVGGTGKTPFCIALCNYLKEQGYRPGLVSRGYKGHAAQWPQTVTAVSDPGLVGDEPVLLAQRTQCPMVVAPDRVAAVSQLLRDYPCDVVISDDGLQHHRLARDIEIIIVNSSRGVGNGLCLPAGPLREARSRLLCVDWVIENGSQQMTLQPGAVYALANTAHTITPADVVHKRIAAVAGIAHPQRFFDLLVQCGFVFESHCFADHHFFTAADLHAVNADIIIMTEKDAVKCQQFADERCYVLPITAYIQEDILQAISAKLNYFLM